MLIFILFNSFWTQSAGAVEYTDCISADAGALRNAEYPYIAIAFRFTLFGEVVPDRVLSIGQLELNCVPETELLEILLFLHLSVCKQ